MKTIRYISACLLLLSGMLHIFPIVKSASDPNAVPMMVFGIIYFAIGVMLIMKIKISSLLGFVFPLIGLGAGFFVVGFKNWTAMLDFLFAIDIIVMICCFILLINKKN